MELINKVNALILGLAMLLVVGCGKESKQDDPEPTPEKAFSSCKIKKRIVPNRENNYSYDNKGNIILTTNSLGGTEVFEYNNLGKVSRLIVLRAVGDTSQIINYEYNSDSLLIRKTSHSRSMPGTPFFIYNKESYNYDSQKRRNEMFTDVINPSSLLKLKNRFTYITNNKVRNEAYTLNSDGITWELASDMEITFDNQRTPYGKNEVFFWLMDHNILSMVSTSYSGGAITGTNIDTRSYTYNSAGYPVEMVQTNSGQPSIVLKYEYTCQ